LLARYSRRVVVNYDPDSAGVAATERSLTLLLEEGFEAKVLALPGGLDPDSFVRKQGAGVYRELLAAAPSYLDYLTERAVATHNVSTPEGKVAAANAVMPYLGRVPNPMLRAELASRLAERLRLDERLLREELRRAAGEGRRQVEVKQDVAATASPAEKQLLRVFLEHEDLADEFLPELVEGRDCEGLITAPIFGRMLEMRRRGESIQPANLGEMLIAEERRLLYESVFWACDLSREQTLFSCQELRERRLGRESARLKGAINLAEREKDPAKLAELLETKSRLDKQLRAAGGHEKNSSRTQTK
jgi:DNA primase